ncbi:MAG: DUF1533 domain-containing protein [Bacteroidia bacterium]|nr:DUF1533 domain-containing protein [Bacteroidia bacterium]
MSDASSPYPFTAPALSIGVTPVLSADASLNDTLNDIGLTFEDFEPWRQAIASILVDGNAADTSQYRINPGNITLKRGVFSEIKDYEIKVLANGYCEAVLSQSILKAAPQLVADSISNNVGNEIQVSFADNAEWRSLVSQVFVDDSLLDTAYYQFKESQLILADSLFEIEGDYTLTINADGYTQTSLLQIINPPVTDLNVVNPIARVEVVVNTPSVKIALGNVFASPQDPNAPIKFALLSNSKPELFTASIEGDTLILSFSPEVIGEGVISLGAKTGQASAETSFVVTIIADDLGKALALAGGEYVTLGEPEALNFQPDQDDFTITAWFKVPAGIVGTIVGKAAASNRQYQIFTFGDEILYQIGGNAVEELGASAKYTPNQWHHVALVVDNSDSDSVKLYLDGKFIRSSVPGSGVNNGFDVLIGARRGSDNSTTGALYNGEVDEVTFWDVALSAEQIQKNRFKLLQGNEPGLVAYYRFDEESGTQLPDLGPNGLNGMLIDTEDEDWVNSYAVLGDIPTDYQNELMGIWNAQPQTNLPVGLDVFTNIQGNNFAILGHNGEEATQEFSTGSQTLEKLNRNWYLFRVGSSDVPATLVFDQLEAGANVYASQDSAFVLLASEDGQNFSLVAFADSVRAGKAYFNVPNLSTQYYSLAIDEAPLPSQIFLVDADTDEVLTDISQGGIVEIRNLPNRNLNILVQPESAAIRSTRFALSGPVNASRLELNAPFALFGNQGSDYQGRQLPEGSYRLEVNGFTNGFGQGVADFAQVLRLELRNEVLIANFLLLDADADTVIAMLNDGDVLSIPNLDERSLSIGVNTHPQKVASLILELEGPLTARKRERVPLYTLFGNLGSDYQGRILPAGSYTVKATAFANKWQQDTPIDSLEISFELQSGEASEVQLMLSPNPATAEMIRVQAKVKANEPAMLLVHDESGNLVHQQQVSNVLDASLDARTLRAGLYYVTLKQGTISILRRLIIQN